MGAFRPRACRTSDRSSPPLEPRRLEDDARRASGHLPDLPEGDHWISDPATDRFGLVSLSGSLSDIEGIRDLIGKDPEIGEEFEILE